MTGTGVGGLEVKTYTDNNGVPGTCIFGSAVVVRDGASGSYTD